MEAQVSFYSGLPGRENAGVDLRYMQKQDGFRFFVKFVCASVVVLCVIVAIAFLG
jgi:hypothetical protein